MKVLSVGYLSSLSATPLLVCEQKGWFNELGFELKPRRQIGWSSLAKNLFGGELSASIMHPSMLIAKAAHSLGNTLSVRGCLVVGFGGDGLVGKTSRREQLTLASIDEKIRFGTFSPDFPDFCAVKSLHPIGYSGSFIQQIEKVPVPACCGVELIESGFIDMYYTYQPWIKIAEKKGVGYNISIEENKTACHASRILVFDDQLIGRDRVFLEDLRAIIEKASDWICNPSNADELYEILKQEEWPLTKEEILSLFKGRENSTNLQTGFQCGALTTRSINLSNEDIRSFWNWYNCSVDDRGFANNIPIPDWVYDLYYIS
ncbi:ABC transporter substrate-binding protein [Candidatus Pelagisphaera phototrophica]|uniref:ABC transporter substrate-binding protein n=1 Tax=Candidatus Pelagisphaera phototrophica TaxID=2684113 RepID=UPI000B71DFA1|nr:ABC transporter substrate-binding protein [Candidatus Pelagisphaera phototrophica]QXD32653.1 ABC transporter substrate-binding protein [Candidatus Pelagisphaera phototrophica]